MWRLRSANTTVNFSGAMDEMFKKVQNATTYISVGVFKDVTSLEVCLTTSVDIDPTTLQRKRDVAMQRGVMPVGRSHQSSGA